MTSNRISNSFYLALAATILFLLGSHYISIMDILLGIRGLWGPHSPFLFIFASCDGNTSPFHIERERSSSGSELSSSGEGSTGDGEEEVSQPAPQNAPAPRAESEQERNLRYLRDTFYPIKAYANRLFYFVHQRAQYLLWLQGRHCRLTHLSVFDEVDFLARTLHQDRINILHTFLGADPNSDMWSRLLERIIRNSGS